MWRGIATDDGALPGQARERAAMAKLNDEQLRALQLSARRPGGCAETELLADGFSIGQKRRLELRPRSVGAELFFDHITGVCPATAEERGGVASFHRHGVKVVSAQPIDPAVAPFTGTIKPRTRRRSLLRRASPRRSDGG
jgi:hypothetical protein